MPRKVCSRKNDTPMAQISGASPTTRRNGRYAIRSVSTAIDVDVTIDTARIAAMPSTGWLSRKPERSSGVATK